jgi:hypothetical protein
MIKVGSTVKNSTIFLMITNTTMRRTTNEK